MANAPRLLSSIPFGAFLAYSPRGSSEVSRRSRLVRDGVKHDTVAFMRDKVVPRLKRELPGSVLEKFFGDDVALVPVPRSAPLRDKRAHWPGRIICEAFVAGSLARETLTLLERTSAVQKSAFASVGGRPTAEHHAASMRLDRSLLAPPVITVVDDVVTKGNTLLAAVSLVKSAFPTATVRGFAVLRTLGLVPDVDRILDPCEGEVLWNGVDADRQP